MIKTSIDKHGVLVIKLKKVIQCYSYIVFVIHIIASLSLDWFGLIINQFKIYSCLSITLLF